MRETKEQVKKTARLAGKTQGVLKRLVKKVPTLKPQKPSKPSNPIAEKERGHAQTRSAQSGETVGGPKSAGAGRRFTSRRKPAAQGT